MTVDSPNPKLAPISAELAAGEQAEALRGKLGALRETQGKTPVPAKDLDAFLADNPEVKEDLIALDFNKDNPMVAGAMASLDEFLGNLGPAAVATKSTEGGIHNETSFEPVVVTGKGPELSAVEKLAIDIEDMGYTDAVWKSFLSKVSIDGLPDRGMTEWYDASTDRMYAANVLKLGKSPSEFAKNVKGMGGLKAKEVDWLTMAAPRFIKWYKVQKAQEGLHESRQKKEIEAGYSVDDTGRTVSINAREKPEPVTVKLQRPEVAPVLASASASEATQTVASSAPVKAPGTLPAAVSAAAPEAAPEAPVDYRADARANPKKYLTEGNNTVIFMPGSKEADLAIRIEDLFDNHPEKNTVILTSTRYPNLEFKYGNGPQGMSFYAEKDGSKQRLVIREGDNIAEKQPELVSVVPVAESAEAAPIAAVEAPAIPEVAAAVPAMNASDLKVLASQFSNDQTYVTNQEAKIVALEKKKKGWFSNPEKIDGEIAKIRLDLEGLAGKPGSKKKVEDQKTTLLAQKDVQPEVYAKVVDENVSQGVRIALDLVDSAPAVADEPVVADEPAVADGAAEVEAPAVEPAAPTDASTGETGVADAVKVETLPPPVQG